MDQYYEFKRPNSQACKIEGAASLGLGIFALYSLAKFLTEGMLTRS